MSKGRLGIAIDVVTTTVALHLVDMQTGAKLATENSVNAQAPYGADVTSRIRFCAENGHEKLTSLIRAQLSSMILDVCAAARADSGKIENITIAANTVMQHLVAGFSPVAMGIAPFTPHSLFGKDLSVWEDLPISKNALVYYTPAISAYVGGDITAGLLAADFEDISEPAVFLDIGTNGEIVLKHEKTYYCCAAAAGPAFEGAEIAMGMAAQKGAIDHVTWDDGIKFSVIGADAPSGICGSGLLDTLAVLLDTGDVDKTGRLRCRDKYRLTTDEHDVYITAGDIRTLQLAKAAIAAGIQVLQHYAGISDADIETLALAGGFGSYMNTGSAARIGLFPKCLLPKAKAFGNTAGEGAAMTLYREDARSKLENIRANCEYIELSSMGFFNDKFIEEMYF